MEERRATRRGVLAAAGAAGIAGLAGCSGDDGDGDGGGGDGNGDSGPETTDDGAPGTTGADDGSPQLRDGSVEAGEIPGYATCIPALDGSGIVFTAFDLATDDGHRLDAAPDEPTDPLRFNAAFGAVAATVMATFMLDLEPGFSADRFGLDEQTQYVGVGGVGVSVMPVDLAGVRSDLDEGDAEVQYDGADAVVLTSSEGRVFGVTADAFVFAPASESVSSFDPVERVRAVVDARAGAATPLHEADDGFASLLQRGDTTGAVSCAYAPEGDLGTLAEQRSIPDDAAPYRSMVDGHAAATGAVYHLTASNGDPPQPATATITYPSADGIDEETLTTTVGAAASDRSYVRDGTTVRAEGTYSWEDLSDFEREDDGLGVQ